MTFRDDHDAALARVDALDAELARTKAERDTAIAERDELRTKLETLSRERDELREELEKAKPKPRPKPAKQPTTPATTSARKKLYLQIALWVAGGLLVAIAFTWGTCNASKKAAAHDAWRARVKEAERYKQRWQRLTRFEPCVRWTATGEVGPLEHRHPSKFDPRTHRDPGYSVSSLKSSCTSVVKELAEDPATPLPWKAPLTEWLAIEDTLEKPFEALNEYESNADWREDNGAARPALWKAVEVVLAQRRPIIAKIRKIVLPGIRAELRGIQKRHEAKAGRDATWWRMELGIALWEINDLSLEKSGVYEGRWYDLEAAAPHLREPVKAWVEAGKQAPIEVRRELRKIEWITQPIIEGQLPRGETPLWHLHHSDADLLDDISRGTIPAIPDPGPEPERPSDD